MEHTLHHMVGDCLCNHKFPDARVIRDSACGGQHSVPLFCSLDKSNKTEYCNVDMLVLKNNEIRAIIEIEESNVSPTQICGKFLTSVLSSCYIHESGKNAPIEMSDSVLFLQILSTSQLGEGTSKGAQWENLRESIVNMMPIKGSNVKEYKLLVGNVPDFRNGGSGKCTELITIVAEALK